MPGKEAELPSKRIVCLGRNSSIKDYGRPLRCRSGRRELGEVSQTAHHSRILCRWSSAGRGG